MDGKYLASNIEPLVSLADGRVYQVITAILDACNVNKTGADKGELVANKIVGSEKGITRIDCLINTTYGLHYRSFNLFIKTGTIDDDLKQSASYGYGIHDLMMDRFIKFREWYLQNKEVPAEV